MENFIDLEEGKGITEALAQGKDMGSLEVDERGTKEVLMGMKDGKTPGQDGLPAEFHKLFWQILGPEICEVFSGVVKGGEAPASWKEAVTVLSGKAGDKEEPRNYRPISLLNCVYMLFMRLIGQRFLGPRLGEVVGGEPDGWCGRKSDTGWVDFGERSKNLVREEKRRGIPCISRSKKSFQCRKSGTNVKGT